jgi:hypothetical protein
MEPIGDWDTGQQKGVNDITPYYHPSPVHIVGDGPSEEPEDGAGDHIQRREPSIHDRDQGLHSVIDGRQTVERYLSNWLTDKKPRIRESTWISYEHRLRLHVIPAIGKKTLIKLLPGNLSRLYADLIDTKFLSPSTVLKTHGIMHHALKDAVRANLVSRNIAELVDPPRAEALCEGIHAASS